MKVSVSAPGKILLMGEHAVVYGKPALLSSIDKRIYVQAEKIKSNNHNGAQVLNIQGAKDVRLIKKTISIFKDKFSLERLPDMNIKVRSSLPIGSGLGSSAALSAAISAALLKLVKNIWNPVIVNKLTFRAEKYSHGNPSGADNSAVVLGGLIWFRKEFDFLRSIWKLPIDRYKMPDFILIDSGMPVETTKEMVDKVSKFKKRNKVKFENILQDQELLTKKLLMSLRKYNLSELSDSISKGERNLERLGVVGKEAKNIIRNLEKMGFSAKICGAGGIKKGSGMILCLVDDKTAIDNIIKKLALKYESLSFTDQGLRIEKNK